jgi:hypothetical protein
LIANTTTSTKLWKELGNPLMHINTRHHIEEIIEIQHVKLRDRKKRPCKWMEGSPSIIFGKIA